MQPIQPHLNLHQDLQRLRALDTDQNGHISRSEVQNIDHNGDGQVSKQEWARAGFRDEGLRREVQQRYTQGRANPHQSLFQESDLIQRQNRVRPTLEARSQQLEQQLSEKIEGFTQTVLNHFDRNHDNRLSVSEVRDINRAEAKRLGKEFGLESTEVDKIIDQLQQLARLRENLPQTTADPQVLPPSTGTDFASGMRYLDDPADQALKAAKTADPKALRQSLQQQYPQLRGLLHQLTASAVPQARQAENLVMLREFMKQHPPEKAQAALEVLTQWAARKPGAQDVIKPAQRADYLNALLRDLAFPEDINQGEKGTCAAAAIQMELARKDPKKYLELATTLARGEPFRLLDTPQGEVRRIYPNRSFERDRSDDRLLSSRLIQDSFMDLGHQAGEDESHAILGGRARFYDSRLSVDSAQGLDENEALQAAARQHRDLGRLPASVLARLSDGLSEGEMEYLAQGLFGNQWQDLAAPYHEVRMEPDSENPGKLTPVKRVKDPAALLRDVDQALALGRRLTIASDDHAMLLTGKEVREGKTLYVVHSWSGRYLMTPEALQQRLTNVFTEPLTPSQ